MAPPGAPAPPKPGPDIFKLPPPGPETPEERLNRILKEPLPSGPQKRSFSEAFWKWADENVIDRGLSSLGIAKKYRGLLRDVAHAAVEKGAESALDKAMDAAHLDSKQKDAFKAIIRQLMQMK